MFLYVCKHIHIALYGYVRISPLNENKISVCCKITLAWTNHILSDIFPIFHARNDASELIETYIYIYILSFLCEENDSVLNFRRDFASRREKSSIISSLWSFIKTLRFIIKSRYFLENTLYHSLLQREKSSPEVGNAS